MSGGFGRGVGNLGIAISDLGGTAVTVVHHDHFLDVVQLNRRAQVLPERLVPFLEGRRHNTDGRTGDSEGALLAAQIIAGLLLVNQILNPRIDARQHHGLVVAGCRHGFETLPLARLSTLDTLPAQN